MTGRRCHAGVPAPNRPRPTRTAPPPSSIYLAGLAAVRGDPELAARRLGSGERHFGMAIPPFMQISIDETTERVLRELDPDRFEALRAEGAATSVEAALALAEYTGS